MEVASPLTVPHAAAGTKRSLGVCSPVLMDTTALTPFGAAAAMSGMEMDDSHVQRAFKRRRFQTDTSMEPTEDAMTAYPPFSMASLSRGRAAFSGNATVKRCRQEVSSPVQNQPELERVVETQANEIEYLKTAKQNLENSLASLKTDHDKTLNENRILKRAVAIQQERQTQASNDLEAARQYKSEAEQNIRRLEQMIISLRYHLQAQQSHPGNDFMGFPPAPPDVY